MADENYCVEMGSFFPVPRAAAVPEAPSAESSTMVESSWVPCESWGFRSEEGAAGKTEPETAS